MVSLQSHHTFGLTSQCDQLIRFHSVDQFLQAFNQSAQHYILGQGSNTIFLCDYQGTVFLNQTRGLHYKETETHHNLRVAGGENWHELVTQCLHNGWYGLENLALIPGTVGAAPIQNIGAYGVEVERFITSVEFIHLTTGEPQVLQKDDCEFGYRDSIFKHKLAGECLITHVNFSLPKNYQPVCTYGELKALSLPALNEQSYAAIAAQIYAQVIQIRREKLPDPAKLGNAGSFFKNPVIPQQNFNDLVQKYPAMPYFMVESGVKVPAAWLIDQAGGKLLRGNHVGCHASQPLVITNLGGAQGTDLIEFVRALQSRVFEKFAIQLEPEVRLVGEQGLIQL